MSSFSLHKIVTDLLNELTQLISYHEKLWYLALLALALSVHTQTPLTSATHATLTKLTSTQKPHSHAQISKTQNTTRGMTRPMLLGHWSPEEPVLQSLTSRQAASLKLIAFFQKFAGQIPTSSTIGIQQTEIWRPLLHFCTLPVQHSHGGVDKHMVVSTW